MTNSSDRSVTIGGEARDAVIVTGDWNVVQILHEKPQDIAKAPYKFLSYYDISDRGIFFGRDAAIDELSGQITRKKVVILNGQSGSGKTSLINAGVIPRLAENGYRYVSIRDYTAPLRQLREFIRGKPEFGGRDVGDQSLLEILRSIRNKQKLPVVLIFDQFERFFVAVDPATRRAFLEEMRQCLESGLCADELNLVFSLRQDFFGQLVSEAEAVIPTFWNESHHHNLRTLSPNEARQAILGPLKDVANVSFDIRFVDDVLLPQLMREGESEAEIEPPHLQIVCNQLYVEARRKYAQQMEDGQPALIGDELYSELGKAEGMLRDYLDNVVSRITGADPEKTGIVRSILKLMIETTGTRRFKPLVELLADLPDVPTSEAEETLNKLQDSRVLESRQSDGHIVYSLSHEFMVAKVQSWYDRREMERAKARETLANGVRQWVSTKATLDYSEVSLIELWLPADSLGAEERALLNESRSRHRREKRTRQVAFAAVGFVLILAVAATLLAMSAKHSRARRRAAEITAIEQESRAREQESLKLVAEAYQKLYRDPLGAVAKARNAVAGLQRGADGYVSENAEEIKSTADQGMLAAYRVAILHQENRRETARLTGSGAAYLAGRWKQGQVLTRFSNDGRHMLLVTERGKDSAKPPGDVYLLDNETLRIVKLESKLSDARGRRVEHVSFSGSGQHVFVTRQFYLSVYSLDGSYIGGYPFVRHSVRPVHVAEGFFSRRFVLGGAVGGLWLVDPQKQEIIATLRGESARDPLMSAAISAKENLAILVFESGRATVFYLDEYERPVEIPFLKEGALFAAFHPERENAAITTGRNGVQVWELKPGAVDLRKTIACENGVVDWAKFTPDGNELVVLTTDHTLSVIDLDTAEILTSLDEAYSIDWAARKTLPDKSAVLDIPTPEYSAEPIVFPSKSLRVREIKVVSDTTWLLADNPNGDALRGVPVYRVDGEKAIPLSTKEMNTGVVASVGGYQWLLPTLSTVTKDEISVSMGGGAVFRVDGNSAVRLPSRDAEVNSIMSIQGKTWLATTRGAYELEHDQMVRKTDENLNVTRIDEIKGGIWLSTSEGAYVIDDNRVIQVTSSTEGVRELVQAGGSVWILMGKKAAPAYRVDFGGYLAKLLPRYDSKIRSVIELNGKAWLLAQDGLYRWESPSFVRIEGIDGPVISVKGLGEDIWATTGWVMRGQDALGPRVFRVKGMIAEAFLDSKKVASSVDALAGNVWVQTGGLGEFAGPAYVVTGNTTKPPPLPSASSHVWDLAEVDGDVWLRTSESDGRFRFVAHRWRGGHLKTFDMVDASVEHILSVGGQTWLLTNSGAARVDGDGYTKLDTDGQPVWNIVKVDEVLWLLTGRESDPARAYRVDRDSTTPFPDQDIGITGVHKIGERVYFVTRKNGNAGPLLPVDE